MAYKPFSMPEDIHRLLSDEVDRRRATGEKASMVSILRERLNLPAPQDEQDNPRNGAVLQPEAVRS